MFLKKITIFFLIFSFWIWNVFATEDDWDNSYSLTDANESQAIENNNQNSNSSSSNWGSSSSSCEWWKDSLCSAEFEIDTSAFSPATWENFKNWSSWKRTIEWFLTTLIQKLMIALWSIALFVMIIWAWFMIFAMWKDDNLNKWKTIFKAWIIALVIALSSYMMVSLLKYILYINN